MKKNKIKVKKSNEHDSNFAMILIHNRLDKLL